MYKVLIVDDEAAHRKGIMKLLNRRKPEYFLLEARDGAMAELILDTVDIDIILTDIRMPNKDGLAFLSDLYEAKNQAKVIMISGYGQFSYAREALAKGAFDFLLKPIDPKELEQSLNKAEESLRTERSLKQNQSRYLDLLLAKMVKGNLNAVEREQLEGILPRNTAGILFAVRTDQKERIKEEERFFRLRQTVREALHGYGHTILFELFEGGMAAGMVFLEPTLWKTYEESVLHEIRGLLCGLLPKEMDFGMSRMVSDLYEHAAEAFMQAEQALQRTFYLDGGGEVYAEGQEADKELLRLLAEKESELAEGIKYGDHQKVKEMLSDIFGAIDEKTRPYPNRIKELFVLLGMRIVYLLQKKGEITEYHQAISMYTNRIMDADHMAGLQEEVGNLCLMLNDISRQDDDGEDVIRLSVRYLEEHFAEEITLPQIAEKFYFTPSYYSIYFKKRTGKPFSQYLTAVRMENACRKLCETNKKIGEISLEVGYGDSAYFGKVFKKCEGCSPEEYRKRNYRI